MAQPVVERVNVSHILGGALKPFDNDQAQCLAKLVIRQAQSTEANAVLRLLGHIRRQEARQVQRSPNIIVTSAIRPRSDQTKRHFNASMSLKQIEQGRKPVEIPITNRPAQAIGVPIQVGAHGRCAAPVQKANHTRRTRAIRPAKPIPFEPLTRIIQVFLSSSMTQQSLNLGIRKAEPPIAPRRERGR